MIIEKKLFSKNHYFSVLLSGCQTVDLRSNMMKVSERALIELLNALSRGAVALLVLELRADL